MEKKLAFNPYLPFWETVPDGEPHVFDGRVYVFGSHDRRNGTTFCEQDYVGWSAPVDDLGDWRYEGVIYRKEQDPINGAAWDGTIPAYKPAGSNPHLLYAPDVAKGRDGRYYLYYSLDFTGVISVAVCDTPAGQYEFLGYVTCPDGTIPEAGNWYDPAILVEDSGIYLYFGFCPNFRFPGMEEGVCPGAMMVKLAEDMHTIVSEPVCVANAIDTCKGTPYEAHPFFEASSIRRIGDLYYFVYSSLQGHELCYGTAKTPEGPFDFKGVIVSNGDIGLDGREYPVNYIGNNHGGLVELGEKVYIFWHRQTHGTNFSRQGCADEVRLQPDGAIPQTEITSCGLNGGPLPARGTYLTYIACHVTEADVSRVGHVVRARPGEALPPLPEEMPYITEEADPAGERGLKPYIANLRQGAVAGFKYFSFDGMEKSIELELRGAGEMELRVDRPDGPLAAAISSADGGWKVAAGALDIPAGRHALYFATSRGTLDFAAFTIR